MAIPVKEKLEGIVGITFYRKILVTDELGEPLPDFGDYAARMKVRTDFGVAPPVLDLDNDTKGGLEIDSPNLILTITAAQMRTLDPVSYKYDIEIESSGGFVYQIMYGTFKVKDAITEDLAGDS